MKKLLTPLALAISLASVQAIADNNIADSTQFGDLNDVTIDQVNVQDASASVTQSGDSNGASVVQATPCDNKRDVGAAVGAAVGA